MRFGYTPVASPLLGEDALNQIWGVPVRHGIRTTVRRRLVSLLVLLGAVATLVAALAVQAVTAVFELITNRDPDPREIQLLIAWGTGMALFLLNIVTQKSTWFQRIKPYRFDILLGAGLWLLALVVWTRTPLTPNWFVTQPRTPNFQNYPNSDALRYDRTSQSQLVGEGFSNFSY